MVYIQRISHEAAVIVSALKTIFTYRNIPCTLSMENSKPRRFSLTNLGVLKNPHFAGGLCYDTSIRPDDGNFCVNLAFDMTRREAVRTLARLHRRQFNSQPNTHSWITTKLALRSALAFALEMDGEVVQANKVEFKLIPKVMRCCR